MGSLVGAKSLIDSFPFNFPLKILRSRSSFPPERLVPLHFISVYYLYLPFSFFTGCSLRASCSSMKRLTYSLFFVSVRIVRFSFHPPLAYALESGLILHFPPGWCIFHSNKSPTVSHPDVDSPFPDFFSSGRVKRRTTTCNPSPR